MYFDIKQYQSAIQTYENLLKDYPETNNAERVRYMIARSAYLLAANSFVEKQEPRFREAVSYATEFLERYPKSEFKNEVSSFYDNSRKKLNQLTNVGYQN